MVDVDLIGEQGSQTCQSLVADLVLQQLLVHDIDDGYALSDAMIARHLRQDGIYSCSDSTMYLVEFIHEPYDQGLGQLLHLLSFDELHYSLKVCRTILHLVDQHIMKRLVDEHILQR